MADSHVVQAGAESPAPLHAAMLPQPLEMPSHPQQAEPNGSAALSPDLQGGGETWHYDTCPSPRALTSIRSISPDISIKRKGLTGGVGKELPRECSLGDAPVEPRHWEPTTFAFTAASTCHKPVYFEDEQLERYGHTYGPIVQTTVSAVKFYATVPLLPYYMGVYPPNECIYDLGTYRPGSCTRTTSIPSRSASAARSTKRRLSA